MSILKFDTAAAQADLCRLLAACYYEPGPEFSEEGLFDSLIDAARRLDPVLESKAKLLKSAFEAEDYQDLLVDYAKLFIGPNGTLAPPYESAWRDKNSASPLDSTQALIELYDEGGFEMDEEFRDLPDHLAVELEFLYTLFFQMAAAIKNKDQAAMDHAIALRWALLEHHLVVWIEPFSTAMKSSAACEFYRQLGELTCLFIKNEHR